MSPVARVSAFPPILGDGPRVLILGSLPGVASLTAQQYYAHPRNLFWDLMGDLFGAARDLPYEQRTRRLRQCGIAVWDVLGEALRPGSLDSDIEIATATHNDIGGLLAAHPGIGLIACNGAKAAQLLRRSLPEQVRGDQATRRFVTLPSTSPAHAGRSRAQKLEQWRVIAAYARHPTDGNVP